MQLRSTCAAKGILSKSQGFWRDSDSVSSAEPVSEKHWWIDVFLRLEGRKPKAAWIVISGVFLGLGKNAVFDHNFVHPRGVPKEDFWCNVFDHLGCCVGSFLQE